MPCPIPFAAVNEMTEETKNLEGGKVKPKCAFCDHYAKAEDEYGIIDSDCLCVNEEGDTVCEFSMQKADMHARARFLFEGGYISLDAAVFLRDGRIYEEVASTPTRKCVVFGCDNDVPENILVCNDCIRKGWSPEQKKFAGICTADGCTKPVEDGFAFCHEHRAAWDEHCDELCDGAADRINEGGDE